MADAQDVAGFGFGSSYRLERVLGQGASGVVYEGVDKRDGSAIAAKILKDEHSADPELVTRFL